MLCRLDANQYWRNVGTCPMSLMKVVVAYNEYYNDFMSAVKLSAVSFRGGSGRV